MKLPLPDNATCVWISKGQTGFRTLSFLFSYQYVLTNKLNRVDTVHAYAGWRMPYPYIYLNVNTKKNYQLIEYVAGRDSAYNTISGHCGGPPNTRRCNICVDITRHSPLSHAFHLCK